MDFIPYGRQDITEDDLDADMQQLKLRAGLNRQTQQVRAPQSQIQQPNQPQQPTQPAGTKVNQMNPIDRYEMEKQKKDAGMSYDTRIDSVRTPQDIAALFRESELDEAEYQGRKVPLGKPMAGDVKKSKVYVKKPNGNVVKVNFGDKNMKIKKSNPKRRKSFRARHHCENPGPRWKARYWSCRAW